MSRVSAASTGPVEVSQAIICPSGLESQAWTLHVVFEFSGTLTDTSDFAVGLVRDGRVEDVNDELRIQINVSARWYFAGGASDNVEVTIKSNGGWSADYYTKSFFHLKDSADGGAFYDSSATSGAKQYADFEDSEIYALTLTCGTGTGTWSRDAATSPMQIYLSKFSDGVAPSSWSPVYTVGSSAAANAANSPQAILCHPDVSTYGVPGTTHCLATFDRALDSSEIASLHKLYTPDHYPANLRYFSTFARSGEHEILPSGATATEETSGSQTSPTFEPSSAPLLFRLPPITQISAALPAVTLAIPTVDGDTAFGFDTSVGELLAIPTVDADTVYGLSFVTGYQSPMVGIRDVLSTTIEALTPPEEFDRSYVRAPTFSLPDGVAGFRMFAVTVDGASNILEVGPSTHQVEHEFTVRVRIATGTESLEYQFSDLTNEAMKLMSAINDQNLSTISGADFVECGGFEIEEAENDDHDLLLACRALTQETS